MFFEVRRLHERVLARSEVSSSSAGGACGIAPSLASRVETGADAAQIADAIVSTLRELEAALFPIIGRGGVAALYERSLHLTAPSHPWLSAANEGDQTRLSGTNEGAPAPVDLAVLKAILAQQSSASAAAGGGAFLQTIYDLLTSLVGPSLAERLVRPAGTGSSSGLPAQDALRWPSK